MELLLDPEFKVRSYHLLLFMAGFFWEKNVLLPLSVCVYRYLQFKNITAREHLNFLASSMNAACAGQVFLRVLFDFKRPWVSISLFENISTVKTFIVCFGLVYAPALWAAAKLRSVPVLFKVLLWQWPVWILIYLSLGGIWTEMRAFLVMVPYTFPLLGMLFDDITEKSQQTKTFLFSS